MRRKRIAVISAENEANYQNRVIKGINAQAASLGCEILVFTTFMRSDRGTSFRDGEINIYNLINFDEIDGIIVLYIPLEQDNLLDVIYPKLKEKAKCPIICVDNMGTEHFFDDEITVDDFSGMKSVTDHVIEIHGCKNIYCITGPEDDRGALLRRKGFISSMNEHGLDCENKIFHGIFWYDNGEAIADKILSGELECPEAVVCASDAIAAGIVNRLTENGIKVPEDVIVTGYDASDIAVYNPLCITSVQPPIERLGAQALIRLWKLITNEDCTDLYADTEIEIKKGQSCGCESDNDYIHSYKISSAYYSKRNYNVGYIADMGYLNDSMMTENLTQSTSSFNCYERIGGEVYLLNGTYRFFEMYMCEGWDDVSAKDNYLREGYGENVRVVLHNTAITYLEEHPYLRNEHGYCVYDFLDYIQMDTRKMAIDIDERYDEAFTWYFTPVHFADRCFGYMVLICPFDVPPFNAVYRNWARNVNNALEMQRIRNNLMYNSLRDGLTGLYNRKGLEKFLQENSSRNAGRKIFYMIADMDGLKYINDNFGHNEGDNGIKAIASATVATVIKDEICVRTGGDEFAVVGFGDYNESDIEEHVSAFNEYISKYNKSSDKQFSVHASIGFCCEEYDCKKDISYYSAIADKQMYKNKLASKKSRRGMEAALL